MTNAKELLIVAEVVSKEKGVDKEDVLFALEEGIETALRRDFPEGSLVKVTINSDTGEIKSYRAFKLVDQIENIESEMLHSEIEDELVEDGYALEPFSFELNRQQFMITKQVALQKIKQDSRNQHIQDLLDRSNQLLIGTVKSFKRDQYTVDVNGLEIPLFKRNMLPRDNFKPGEKIYFVLEKDGLHYSGNRISNKFLTEVFKREIVQIEEGDIEIVKIARSPGFRSKIILKSNIRNLDPVKACIGPKGIHIKNIYSTLGENVDLIAYNTNVAQMLIQALLPVNVSHIVIDEDTNTLEASVPDEEISQAIGKSGKNIELISTLLDMTVKVFSDSEWENNSNNNNFKYIATLKSGLNCDEDLAQLIVDSGFTTLEEVAYLPTSEFYIEDLDEETTAALRENALNTLKDPIQLKKSNGLGDLLILGFSEEDVALLQNNNVFNNFDISELSSYDLVDILTTLDLETASSIVSSSRKKESIK